MAVDGAVISARELYRFYHVGDEETLALRGVSVDLHPGSMVAVRGPSGSGKSTLLNCIAGLDDPDGGYVEIRGQRMSRKSEPVRARIRAREIGIYLQEGNLFPHLTIGENVRMQLRIAGNPTSKNRVRALLDSFGISHLQDARPAHVSGGESARAGLAVALANNPPVLIADEPTGELDAESERIVLDVLRAYAKGDRAVLVVTHSSAVAALADRIIDLFDGRITTDGKHST